jgi:hypothetical protein
VLRGAALSVDSCRGHLFREPRRQPRCAADVERLLSDLPDTAGDDLLDLSGLDAVPLKELCQDTAQEPCGMDVGQSSIPSSEGRPNRVNYKHLLHYSIVEC